MVVAAMLQAARRHHVVVESARNRGVNKAAARPCLSSTAQRPHKRVAMTYLQKSSTYTRGCNGGGGKVLARSYKK
jgi:hypothetical protein